MACITAEIIGSDRCEAEGHTVRAAAPVLAMCRKLIEAGYDPATPLHAYRGDNLALTVSTIGWGAKHTVEDSRCGTPVLRRYRPPTGIVSASPMRRAA
jgi:hypothetical protein